MKKAITIRVDENQLKTISDRAVLRDCSLSEALRSMITDLTLVDQIEQRMRDVLTEFADQ